MTRQKQVFLIERSNNLSRYFKDIAKFEIVDAETEVELVEKAHQGDDEARKKLMSVHQRYIFSFAKRYTRNNNTLDLVSVATEGFAVAIDKFDPTRGFRLCSYANYWMRERILAYYSGDENMIKRPKMSKLEQRITAIRNKWYAENGYYPTSEELVDILYNDYGISIKNESDLYDIIMMSIDSYVNESTGETYGDTIEFNKASASENDYEENTENDYAKEVAHILLNTLNERERDIITRIFGIGRPEQTVIDVAQELGYTPERIRQIKALALDKMKNRPAAYSHAI